MLRTLPGIKAETTGRQPRRIDRKRLLASLLWGQHWPMPRDFLQPSAERLMHYPFRFRDPVSGKWVRARYKAERTEIATRYAN